MFIYIFLVAINNHIHIVYSVKEYSSVYWESGVWCEGEEVRGGSEGGWGWGIVYASLLRKSTIYEWEYFEH